MSASAAKPSSAEAGGDNSASSSSSLQPDGRHPYECFAHFRKHKRFGMLDPVKKDMPAPWAPYTKALIDRNDRAMAQVTSKDADGTSYVSPEGKTLTAGEYWRQKKFDENMYKLEADSYEYAKELYSLELQRLGRGHDTMDGGALWIGRILICDETVWLALWARATQRFKIVLDTLRQRGVYVDTKMEYRPPVILPRPYMQLALNHTERPEVLKELLSFSLNGMPIHVVDLRGSGIEDRSAAELLKNTQESTS
ncbi:unnamed protein product [Amoebophrya sp. A25]|nr:unnamed protein product [Amoebophrya sp. A25]|eukprot:GSA25T00011878001.1